MKLGIKTTDGVSRLKLKTADGVSKAVPCACCDPCSGLWGPGYDSKPDTVTIEGFQLGRINKCLWVIGECYCENQPGYLTSACPEGCGFYFSMKIIDGPVAMLLVDAAWPYHEPGFYYPIDDEQPTPLGVYKHQFLENTVTVT